MDRNETQAFDELFCAELTAYQEQLDSAEAAPTLALDDTQLPAALQTRMLQARRCLNLLNRLRRNTSAAHRWGADVQAGEFALRLPSHVNRFEVRALLGAGGFGLVYRAWDPITKRHVAIKTPRLEAIASSELRERFDQEAQAAARLDHPNIVAVLEAGADGPIPYIASPFIDGLTLAAWLKQHIGQVSPRLAAHWISALADAVQHAHARGVLHRDIKPSNVLLAQPSQSTMETTPDESLIPKLMDFGLAKLAESQRDMTQTGALLGTVRYMSPEQARGKTKEIGVASDIYSLGAVLYELLAGEPPFAADTDLEVLRKIETEDPSSIRIRARVPRDLETICLKCLEKQVNRRYASARELAADLRRFLAGEPIRARHASTRERLIKWTRRHPTAAALWSVTAIGLVVLIAGTALSNRWLRQERDRTLNALAKSQASERTARRHVYASEIKHAHQAMLNLEIAQCLAALKRYLPSQGEEDLRDFSWNFMWRALHRDVRRLPRHPGSVYALAFSPDGRLLATACADGKVRLWEYATGQLEAEFVAHSGEVNAVAFSSDGARLATGGDDGEAIVWDVAERSPLQRLPQGSSDERPISSVIFSPDGNRLYTAGGHFLFAWNIDTRQQLCRLPIHDRDIRSMGLSADGRFLAASAGRLQVFDTATWQSKISTEISEQANWMGVLFWPDSQRLLVGDDSRGITQLDIATGTPLSKLELAPTRRLTALAYEPESQILAACSDTRVVAAQSLDPNGRIEAVMLGHTDRVWDVKFAPDGRTLVSAGADGDVIVWRKPTGLENHLVGGLLNLYESRTNDRLRAHSYSPDGRYLVFGGQLGNLLLLDCATNKVDVLPESGMAYALAFMPDGQHIVYGSKGGADGILVYDLNTRRRTNVATLESDLVAVCVSPRGDVVVAASGGLIRRFSLPSWRELAYLPTPVHLPTSIAFSPSGARLAVLSGSELVLYDTGTWQPALRIDGFEGQFLDIDFFSDEKRIAVAEGRRSVVIRDAISGRELMQLSGHPGLADSVAVSRDGHALASVCDHNVLQIWDVQTGQATMQFTDVQADAGDILFSPNGGELAIVQNRGASNLTLLDGRPIVVTEPLPSISTGR